MTDPAIFINVIDVEPDKHQEVLELLCDGAEKVMVKRPGFQSLTLLSSLDRSRIVNIAYWESPDAVKATQAAPEAAELIQRTAALAEASPGLFTVAAEFSP